MVIFCYKLLNETEQLTCHSEIHVNVVLLQAGALKPVRWLPCLPIILPGRLF
jgi:hypothetical protein